MHLRLRYLLVIASLGFLGPCLGASSASAQVVALTNTWSQGPLGPACTHAIGDRSSIPLDLGSGLGPCSDQAVWEDNIVWGTSWDDNIVWGTFWEDDNIVWGTFWEDDNIVWGTGSAGNALEFGAFWEDDNIVWGTSDGETF